MANTGTLAYEIRMDAAGATTDVRKFGGAVNDLGVKGGKSADTLTTSLKGTLKTIAGFAGAYVAFETLKTVLSGLVTVVKNAAVSFTATASSFEKIKTSLTTLTGSSAAAEKSMAWITEFTAKTPYELEQVSENFAKLTAYGFDAAKWMGTLGDTAGSMGKSLTDAVEMFADAATGEFERLKEFGVRAKTEGDTVAFSWMENGRQMVISADKTQTGITGALGKIFERFQGGMEAQSLTWEGMMSNLADSWTLFQKAVMDSGVFDAMKGQLSGILEKVNQWQEEGKIDEWAATVGQAIMDLGTAWKPVADDMLTGLGNILGKIYDWVQNGNLAEWANTAATSFTALANALAPFGTALTTVILPAMEGFAMWMRDTILPAMEGFGLWFNDNSSGIFNFFTELSGFFTDLATGATTLYDGFTDAFDEVTALFDDIDVESTADDVVGYFEDLYEGAVGYAEDLYDDVVEYFADLYSDGTDELSGLADDIVGYFEDIYDDAVGYAEDLYDDVVGYFEDLYDDVTDTLADLNPFSGITDSATDALDKVGDLFDGFKDKLGGGAEWVLDMMASGSSTKPITEKIREVEGVVNTFSANMKKGAVYEVKMQSGGKPITEAMTQTVETIKQDTSQIAQGYGEAMRLFRVANDSVSASADEAIRKYQATQTDIKKKQEDLNRFYSDMYAAQKTLTTDAVDFRIAELERAKQADIDKLKELKGVAELNATDRKLIDQTYRADFEQLQKDMILAVQGEYQTNLVDKLRTKFQTIKTDAGGSDAVGGIPSVFASMGVSAIDTLNAPGSGLFPMLLEDFQQMKTDAKSPIESSAGHFGTFATSALSNLQVGLFDVLAGSDGRGWSNIGTSLNNTWDFMKSELGSGGSAFGMFKFGLSHAIQTGDWSFSSLGDAFDQVWKGILGSVAGKVADLAAEFAANSLGDIASSLFGGGEGGGGGGIVSTVTDFVSGIFHEGTSEVTQKDEGLAILEKGEMVIPKDVAEEVRKKVPRSKPIQQQDVERVLATMPYWGQELLFDENAGIARWVDAGRDSSFDGNPYLSWKATARSLVYEPGNAYEKFLQATRDFQATAIYKWYAGQGGEALKSADYMAASALSGMNKSNLSTSDNDALRAGLNTAFGQITNSVKANLAANVSAYVAGTISATDMLGNTFRSVADPTTLANAALAGANRYIQKELGLDAQSAGWGSKILGAIGNYFGGPGAGAIGSLVGGLVGDAIADAADVREFEAIRDELEDAYGYFAGRDTFENQIMDSYGEGSIGGNLAAVTKDMTGFGGHLGLGIGNPHAYGGTYANSIQSIMGELDKAESGSNATRSGGGSGGMGGGHNVGGAIGSSTGTGGGFNMGGGRVTGLAKGGPIDWVFLPPVPSGDDGYRPVKIGEGVVSEGGMAVLDKINRGEFPLGGGSKPVQIHLTVVTPDGRVLKREVFEEMLERSEMGERVIYADGVQ
jgi:hypothetical protein